MTVKQLYVPITKVDAVKRLVYGVAALQQEDKGGETFHYDTSVPYFKAWSKEISDATQGKSLGNIREMHGKSAAGKITQIEFNDSDQQIEICTKVVDDAAWAKVDEGVYTGFSIGGDYVKRWNEQGTKFYTAKPSEISLVDNPAMPGAHFSMVKMDGTQEERSFAKYVAPEGSNMLITNAMVSERAEALAKAAGSTSFAGFITQARTELEGGVAKAVENPQGPIVIPPSTGGAVLRPSGKAEIHEGGEIVETDTKTSASGKPPSESVSDMVAVPLLNEPGNTGDGKLRDVNAPAHPNPEDAPKVPDAKTDPLGKTAAELLHEEARGQVEQVWKAADGTTHDTKAAAISHTVTLNSPAAKLDAAIAKAQEAAVGKADAKKPNPFADKDKKETDSKAKKAETAEPDKAEKAADAKKPYGDVKYADPGYKSDKKHRYPVDTEKHIKAAWSYIHKTKNHTGYTSAQVESIKSNIVAAWKDVIGGEPPAAAEKAFVAGQLQKGMYTVSRLACLIEELNWMHESVEYEAAYEGDNSPVPEQLKGDIASLIGTFKNMVDEETAELFDEDETVIFVDLLEMAASSVPLTQLQKFVAYLGGQSLSKSAGVGKAHALLKAAMPKEHVAKVQEMHDHCCTMGAKCDDGNMGKAAGGMSDPKLAKGMELLSAENADLRGLLEKAVSAIGTLGEQIKVISDQPAQVQPVKTQVIGKGEDGRGLGGDAAVTQDLLKQFSPDALASAAISLTHRAGGVPFNLRRNG